MGKKFTEFPEENSSTLYQNLEIESLVNKNMLAGSNSGRQVFYE